MAGLTLVFSYNSALHFTVSLAVSPPSIRIHPSSFSQSVDDEQKRRWHRDRPHAPLGMSKGVGILLADAIGKAQV